MWQSIKRWASKLFKDHPWLWPIVALVCAVGNLYAYHIHSDTSPVASFFDLAFAIVGFLAFFGLLVTFLSSVFYKWRLLSTTVSTLSQVRRTRNQRGLEGGEV
jgi:hypothetical protein